MPTYANESPYVTNSRRAVFASVVLAVLIVGCSSMLPLNGEQTQPTETLTPASVPDVATPSMTPPAESSSAARFHTLRPTCERPPELVVYIQLGALRSTTQTTNAGINTTWQFAAPSNRRAIGSYDRFVRLIREQYQPLLTAETLRLGPMDHRGMTAEQPVTVTTAAGEQESYVWTLAKQTEGQYAGCWMTTSVLTRPSAAGTTATGNQRVGPPR